MLTRIADAGREVIVPPNDRLIRTILLAIGLVWWSSGGFKFARGAPVGMLLLFVPLWTFVAIAGMLLLLWIAVGRTVFTVCPGSLCIEKRIGGIKLPGRAVHSQAVIDKLHVEQRVRRIKGNKSTRYSVLFDDVTGEKELTWYRQRTKAEAFVAQLRKLAKTEGSN